MDRMQAAALPVGTHPVSPVILSDVNREVPVGDCWHRVDPDRGASGSGLNQPIPRVSITIPKTPATPQKPDGPSENANGANGCPRGTLGDGDRCQEIIGTCSLHHDLSHIVDRDRVSEHFVLRQGDESIQVPQTQNVIPDEGSCVLKPDHLPRVVDAANRPPWAGGREQPLQSTICSPHIGVCGGTAKVISNDDSRIIDSHDIRDGKQLKSLNWIPKAGAALEVPHNLPMIVDGDRDVASNGRTQILQTSRLAPREWNPAIARLIVSNDHPGIIDASA